MRESSHALRRTLLLLAAALGCAVVVVAPAAGTPSGRSGVLYFASDRHGSWDVYAMDGAGRAQFRLTDLPGDEIPVAAAEDDPRVFEYATTRSGGWDVWARTVTGPSDFAAGVSSTAFPVQVFGDRAVFAAAAQETAATPALATPGARAWVETNEGGLRRVSVSNGTSSARLTFGLSQTVLARTDFGSPAASTWSGYHVRQPPGCDLPPTSPLFHGCTTNPYYTPPQYQVPCPLPSRQLAFASNLGGLYKLYRSVDGSSLAQVTHGTGDDGHPDWSPDCRYLTFERRLGTNYDIWVVRVADGRETRLTTAPAADTDPVWSPQGDAIAFASDRTGDSDIWRIDVIKSGADVVGSRNFRDLTRTPSAERAPIWQPIIAPPNAGGTPLAPPAGGGAAVRCTQVVTSAAGGTLAGTPGRDVLCGGAGVDTLRGNGGDDVVVGGGGSDRLYGGSGNDDLRARDGHRDAVVDGGAGADDAEIDIGLDPHAVESF
jgi:hypothetical protein